MGTHAPPHTYTAQWWALTCELSSLQTHWALNVKKSQGWNKKTRRENSLVNATFGSDVNQNRVKQIM